MHALQAAVAVLVLLLAGSAAPDGTLHVRAVQHGGWWEVRYPDGTTSANELHVPAGRSVTIDFALDGAGLLRFDRHFLPRAGSAAHVTFVPPRSDVTTAVAYHFTNPRVSSLRIVADDRFDAWLALQRSPATAPRTPEEARGEGVFLSARCTLCHTVRGVANAEQPVAPDLTHVASRATLAGGAIPNREGYLAGWVVDPETFVPGAGMPVNNIDPDHLHSLLAFLRSLQ